MTFSGVPVAVNAPRADGGVRAKLGLDFVDSKDLAPRLPVMNRDWSLAPGVKLCGADSAEEE